MQFRISNTEVRLASPAAVTKLCTLLEMEVGLEYDADFTCLYGPKWSLIGVQFLSDGAMRIALTHEIFKIFMDSILRGE
jgi:hypothetical protein